MKLNKTKAFTLVELIVVITILAILGTIAFINLQGYSIGARDSKRLSDINNIQKKIGIEVSKGELLGNLISPIKTNSGLTINNGSGTSIQGTANFVNLKENGASFKDPITGGDYILSYSIGGSGTGAYKFTQVATVNEENNQAVVKGNYYQMQTGDSPSITVNSDDYYVIDGGVDLPYDTNISGTTPPPVVCNYQQADIDVLNTSGGNGDFDIYDSNWDSLLLPLTLEQWCDDVKVLTWYGGSTILPEIFTLNLLMELDFYSNGITNLPTEIGNLTNLTYLSLEDNLLTNLPTEIGNLTNLTDLYLSSNQLTSLPSEIGNLTNLTYLHLFYNQLTSLPTEIGNLTNLTYLSLYINELTSLPTEIGNLSSLNTLLLNSNQLSNLPIEIGSLTNLTSLNLYDNILTSIPAEIGNLTNLTDLDLTGNQLTVLPTSIGNLINLTDLDLFNNQFTTLQTEIGDLINLTNLHLGVNQLTTLPIELSNLTNLTGLFFNGNTGLGQLNFFYGISSPNRSQAGIPTVGQTMTIGGNGTNIVISVTP